MENDFIHLIMTQAARSYGDSNGIFNAAGFSSCFMKALCLEGALDGEVVRGILCGRSDVQILPSGHFQICK